MRLIIVILMLATVGALGMLAYQIVNPKRAEQVAAPVVAPVVALPVRVLVAARTLPPGTLVRDSDIAIRPVPREILEPGSLADDDEGRGIVTGALVERTIDQGKPITAASLLRTRDRGFLAAVLAPGTRAVTIGVDPITGVGGLIWPGDHVDIILTQEIERGANPAAGGAGKRIIGETVLTNIRVIAIDQDIVQGAPRGSNVAGKLASTITLQANSDEAEKLAVATRLGHLSLAIRAFGDSIAGVGGAKSKPAISGDDVSPALSASNGAGRTKVQVIQGDQRSEVTFR